jgi:hypothetical protein
MEGGATAAAVRGGASGGGGTRRRSEPHAPCPCGMWTEWTVAVSALRGQKQLCY